MNTVNPSTVAISIAPPGAIETPEDVFASVEKLKAEFAESGLGGATEALILVPVRKPTKDDYFRVRPGENYRLTTVLYEDRETRQFYFVTREAIPHVQAVADASVVTLVVYLTRLGVLGLLPLKHASEASSSSGWQSTAMTAAKKAEKQWTRMKADMALGGYRVFHAESDLGEPEWPDTPFNELLDVAFRDRVIAAGDHPILQKLRGQI